VRPARGSAPLCGLIRLIGALITLALLSAACTSGSRGKPIVHRTGSPDQLRFTDVETGHGFDLLIEALFGGQPWTKVD